MENNDPQQPHLSESQIDSNAISGLTESQIIERLAQDSNASSDVPYPPGMVSQPYRPAAVLIPFIYQQGDWQILYIRRTANQGDPHSGQVAFPGGAADLGDEHLIATALREAREEIGLAPQDVRLLGKLNDFITITGYQVTPIVGRIPWPYPLSLAPLEVSRAFTIPLRWLANPKNHSIQLRQLPAPYEPIPVIYFSPYDGEILWGASARFTLGLLEALGLD